MSDMLKAFPMLPSLSQDDQSLLSKKRRHGEISGRMTDISRLVDSNPELFEMVKDSLDQVIVIGNGDEGMKDPASVKTKGRPKKTRTKSVLEISRRPAKCGVCNKPGHNARQHHND